MQTDQIPSGYKLTEVGIIPSDWDVVKLGDISTNIGDGIHSTPEYVNCSDFYFINGNNLVDGSIKITENTKSISIDQFTKYKKELSDTTILLSINGTIGNLAFFNNENVILGKSAAYINISKSIEKKYIFYFLQSSFIANYFKNELTGSTINNLSLQSIRNTPIILPKSDTEQKRIAQVLSDIDELIRSLDELIIKKRNIKQGTMQLLLTGKQRLPGYSGEWEVKKIGEIAEISRGASPRPIDSPIWYDTKSKIGWVRISDVTESNGKLLLKTKDYLSQQGVSQSRFIPKGNLIMSICATVGLPVITGLDVCIHDGFVSFLKISKNVDVNFIYYKLKEFEKNFKSMGQTGSQSNLNSDIVRECSINIPPLEEQKAIARILSDMDEEIEVLETKRDKYKDIKKGTMQELLTGKTRLV